VKPSKRANPPRTQLTEARRNWGGRLLLELVAIRKDAIWLGEQVGYSTPSSMRQVVNGHQGISLQVYKKIIRLVPEMRGVPRPPLTRERQGLGAYGKHKKHEYPKLGTLESRRAR